MPTADGYDRRTSSSSNGTQSGSSSTITPQEAIQINRQIDALNAELERIYNRLRQPFVLPSERIALETRRGEIVIKIQELRNRLNTSKIVSGTGTGAGGGAGTGTGGASTRPLGDTSVVYNCAVSREAYFTSNQSLMTDFGRSAMRDKFIYASNSPTAFNDAMSLWRNATRGAKGVIQTWLPPGGIPQVVKENNYAPVDSVAATAIQRAGMRFMYNPETIGMSYGQTLEADPLFVAAGKGTALPFAAASNSTISLRIPINRMFDLRHITSGGALRAGTRRSDVWTGQLPTNNDLREIYNRGTMYDIEFLLQAMFPISKFDTQFRGKSLDIGFLGNFPVEMHLGKTLRYVTQIVNLTVTHQIFDNRMVPIYSVLDITAARIPDYASSYASSTTGNTTGSGGSSSSTTGGGGGGGGGGNIIR